MKARVIDMTGRGSAQDSVVLGRQYSFGLDYSSFDDSRSSHNRMLADVIEIERNASLVSQIRGYNTITSSLRDIIYNTAVDTKAKIEALKSLDAKNCKALFEKLLKGQTTENFDILINLFETVAEIQLELGNLTSTLKYFTDAAIFHQYVISILSEKMQETQSGQDVPSISEQEMYQARIDAQYIKLDHLKQTLMLSIQGDVSARSVSTADPLLTNKDLSLAISSISTKQESDVYKYYIQALRKDSQHGVEEVEHYRAIGRDDLYITTSRSLFGTIATRLKDLLATLYQESEQELAQTLRLTSPCAYSVIGLGSLALKQATPYSDLEFAILTQNEDYKQSDDPEIREYFKNLTHLVHFKIIGLGETIIPDSKYGLDLSHLVCRAVNFDLGGKTPLGRIDGDKPYNLIKTIEWMMRYVRNEEDREGRKPGRIDKALPYILENVCYVYGDKILVRDYQAEVTKFLRSTDTEDPQGRPHHKTRAIKVLEEGAVEFNYAQQRLGVEPKQTQFKGDLEKLQPHLSDSEGKLFDVKQEIYRLPDRMIYSLGMLYGIQGESAWDTIEQLAERGIINKVAAHNLKSAVTFATTLRLKTYLHNGAQAESLSLFAGEQDVESILQAEKVFNLKQSDLQEDGGLFKYFYVALELYDKLEEFCARQHHSASTTAHQQSYQALHQSFFQKCAFYKDDPESRGMVYYRLIQYKEAMEKLESVVANVEPQLTLGIYAKTLCDIYVDLNINLDKAIALYNAYLKIETVESNKISLFIGLGNAHIRLGTDEDIEAAIRFYKEAQSLSKSSYEKVNSMGALGNAYYFKGDHHIAITTLEQCIEEMHSLYQDKPHPDIATALNTLGASYEKSGKCHDALTYYKQSLEMRVDLYKREAHPDVAKSLHNLGRAELATQEYELATEHLQSSLRMKEKIHHSETLDVTDTLTCLGKAYIASGDSSKYSDAANYLRRSFEIQQRIYGQSHTIDIVSSLSDLGNTYMLLANATPTLRDVVYYNTNGDVVASGAAKILDYHETLICCVFAMQASLHFHDTKKQDKAKCELAKLLAHYKFDAAYILSKVLSYSDHQKDFIESAAYIKESEDIHPTTLDELQSKIIKLRLAWIFRDRQDLAAQDYILSLLSNLIAVSEDELYSIIDQCCEDSGLTYSTKADRITDLKNADLQKFLADVINNNGLDVVVQILLNSGTNPNQPMNNGDTPMHMAHYKGSKEAIVKLLAAGGKLSTQNQEGKTPLHCLLESTTVSQETKKAIITEFLSQYDLTIPDNNDNTVIDLATTHLPGMLEIMVAALPIPPATLPAHTASAQADTTTAAVDLHLLGEGATNGDASGAGEHHDGT